MAAGDPIRHRNPDTGEVDIDAWGVEPPNARYWARLQLRGWERVPPEEVAAAELAAATGTPHSPSAERTLADFTSDELRDMAAERGVDVPARARKADIVAALEAAVTTTTEED